MNHFLNDFSREELENIIKNQDYIIKDLRERLYKLTGCLDFGGCDGTVGSCHYCLAEDPETFEKCWQFKYKRIDKNDCSKQKNAANLL